MLGPPSPQEGGRRCLASTGGRESSRPFGLTDGSSGISGGVDREGEVLACRREPRAGGPRPEAGQRVGRALELRGRSGEGQREPLAPTPSHPIPSWRGGPSIRMTPPSLQVPYRSLPGDHLVWGGSLQVSASAVASQPFTCWDPCFTPMLAAASPLFPGCSFSPSSLTLTSPHQSSSL